MQTEDQIKLFVDLIDKQYIGKLLSNIREDKKRITVEFSDIAKHSPELADDLIDNPEETLKAADLALETFTNLGNVKGFRCRVRGDIPGNKVRIRDLRSKHIGKFITVEGTIDTKSDVGVVITCALFECPTCGQNLRVLQLDKEFKEPTKCGGCGRKGKFRLLSTDRVDGFTLRLQELASAIRYGSDMKVKPVLCKNDLTDIIIEEKLIEGIRVKINGIYKEQMVSKQGVKQTTLMTFIEANYIFISDETYYDLEITEADIQEIKDYVAKNKDHLIDTVCEHMFQGVYGHRKIKEGLTLQAFGGISNHRCTPMVRGDMHILLVGDGGENKSAFLEYIAKVHPKSVLVVGKSVSGPGLRGTAIKDDMTGSFVLKPGAIPLANQGICLIDELDKMKPEDRDILHEPMEQQRLTINIANITDRKMLARESFLISMNPKNSYFTDYQEIYEQIDLPPTLVSRFDLVYILKKNRAKDDSIRQQEKEKARIMMTRSDSTRQEELTNFHKFMRKYIGYARQNIFPRFDKYLEEEYLPEVYAGLDHERKTGVGGKATFPITARHLFIIRRIAEARRRMFLETTVKVEDIDYAIERIRDSLNDIARIEKTGKLDEEYIVDGVSSKSKNMHESFSKVVEEIAVNNVCRSDLFMEKMTKQGFSESEINAYLVKIYRAGDILYPKGERAGFFVVNR